MDRSFKFSFCTFIYIYSHSRQINKRDRVVQVTGIGNSYTLAPFYPIYFFYYKILNFVKNKYDL